eukprot:930969-Pyramimonas_sp.AAC.1
MPQWQGSHGGLGPRRHTPHTVRGPIGAPPTAPAARFAWRRRAMSARPSHGSWSNGGSTEGPIGT